MSEMKAKATCGKAYPVRLVDLCKIVIRDGEGPADKANGKGALSSHQAAFVYSHGVSNLRAFLWSEPNVFHGLAGLRFFKQYCSEAI